MTTTPSRLPILALAILLAPAPGRAAAGAWAETEQSRVRFVSRWASAAAGGDAGLALEFRLAPGWHVYWKNAGDAGYPPELRAAGDLVDATLRFPPPRRYDLPGGLQAIGYGERVLYPIDGRVALGVSGIASLEGSVDYLVCAEGCLPYTHDLTLELPLDVSARPDEATAPAVDAARASLPVPMADQDGGVAFQHADGRPDGTSALELELWLPNTILAESPDLFFEPDEQVVVERPTIGEGTDGAFLARTSARRLGTADGPLEVVLRWTAVGLVRDGRPLALEGALPVAFGVPGARAPTDRGPSRPLVALAVTAILVLLVLFRPRRAPRAGGAA